jgi:SPP1 family predicted phage head-tail adaptor
MGGLNAGSLVHQVTIQRLTESVDASGAPVEVPSVLRTAFMASEPARGQERFVAGQESAAAMLQWTMRYVQDMDPFMVDVPKERRLLYQGRAYDIVEAESDRKNWIVLKTLSASKVAA